MTMLRRFLIISALCSNIGVYAQDIPNGGFELWDSTFFDIGYYLPPVGWFWGHQGPSCVPFNALAVPDSSAYSGYFSVKLENFVCAVSYTHLRAHETVLDLVCRLLLEKKKKQST